MVRPKFVAAAKIGKRLLVSSDLVEQRASLQKPIRMVWIELNGLAEYLKGVLVAPLHLKYRTELDKIIRLRVEPDRARHPLHSVVVLPGLERHASQEMQRIGVIGLRLQHLPAAELSVEILSGPEVTKARRIEGV